MMKRDVALPIAAAAGLEFPHGTPKRVQEDRPKVAAEPLRTTMRSGAAEPLDPAAPPHTLVTATAPADPDIGRTRRR
ncbi:MAG: hypothetical protein QOI48_807 [Solirubrobacteraceae bacterium]|jgi:hypothetical protein|nr:hypothetical protein [Solirubrobacteraceae bacterium]